MRVMKIVSLGKRRSKVLVDEGFAFALSKDELREYHVEEDGEISPEVFEEIEEVLHTRAREGALRLLEIKDRTEAEMYRKLKGEYFPESIIQEELMFLKDYNLINDMEYGRRYVEMHGHTRSRRWIQEKLTGKGLSREQITQLLDQGEVAEADQIQAYLLRKNYDADNALPDEKKKVFAALMRRGYSYDAVCCAVNGKTLDIMHKTV